MKSIIFSLLAAAGLLAATAAGVVHFGLVDVAADSQHSPAVFRVIEYARTQSVARQAASIAVPADLLGNAERQRRGAGNYHAMCVSCHLAPGMNDSEMRMGLYPQPPNLALAASSPLPAATAAARQFWVIRHGIKGSAMPAWSRGGMDDQAIWDMVAFLQRLPELSADQYAALVQSSDGHAHAGLEAHHAEAEASATRTENTAAEAHNHADHVH